MHQLVQHLTWQRLGQPALQQRPQEQPEPLLLAPPLTTVRPQARA
jgi:hypothetical protein